MIRLLKVSHRKWTTEAHSIQVSPAFYVQRFNTWKKKWETAPTLIHVYTLLDGNHREWLYTQARRSEVDFPSQLQTCFFGRHRNHSGVFGPSFYGFFGGLVDKGIIGEAQSRERSRMRLWLVTSVGKPYWKADNILNIWVLHFPWLSLWLV